MKNWASWMNMKARHFFLTLALLMQAALTLANSELSQIESLLAKPESLTANFTQEKSLAVLTRPLLSKGHVAINKGEKVVWTTTSPIESVITISANGIEGVDTSGKLKNKAFKQVSNLLNLLLNGNFSELGNQFNIETDNLNTETAEWQLSLTPKSDIVAKIIQSMEVSGTQYIQRVLLTEQSGNTTTISFYDIETGSTKASAEPNES